MTEWMFSGLSITQISWLNCFWLFLTDVISQYQFVFKRSLMTFPVLRVFDPALPAVLYTSPKIRDVACGYLYSIYSTLFKFLHRHFALRQWTVGGDYHAWCAHVLGPCTRSDNSRLSQLLCFSASRLSQLLRFSTSQVLNLENQKNLKSAHFNCSCCSRISAREDLWQRAWFEASETQTVHAMHRYLQWSCGLNLG